MEKNNTTPTGGDHYPFALTPLPYAYSALEPYIDTETMTEHHKVLAQRYVDRLNAALKDYPDYHNWTLIQLLQNTSALPKDIQKAVHNNAGGVINHQLYFAGMTPEMSLMPGPLKTVIETNFSTTDNFKAQLKEAALRQFGSGWAMVVVTPKGLLKIVNAANQDTPFPYNGCPILLTDVWEHAYFLQYLADRDTYFENWYKVVNWDMVNHLLDDCTTIIPEIRVEEE